MRLKDKVAVITGAGSGSGRAGAIVFSREGAKEELNRVVSQLIRSFGINRINLKYSLFDIYS